MATGARTKYATVGSSSVATVGSRREGCRVYTGYIFFCFLEFYICSSNDRSTSMRNPSRALGPVPRELHQVCACVCVLTRKNKRNARINPINHCVTKVLQS